MCGSRQKYACKMMRSSYTSKDSEKAYGQGCSRERSSVALARGTAHPCIAAGLMA